MSEDKQQNLQIELDFGEESNKFPLPPVPRIRGLIHHFATGVKDKSSELDKHIRGAHNAMFHAGGWGIKGTGLTTVLVFSTGASPQWVWGMAGMSLATAAVYAAGVTAFAYRSCTKPVSGAARLVEDATKDFAEGTVQKNKDLAYKFGKVAGVIVPLTLMAALTSEVYNHASRPVAESKPWEEMNEKELQSKGLIMVQKSEFNNLKLV